MKKTALGELTSTRMQPENYILSDRKLSKEKTQLICSQFLTKCEEPPKIFWKFYDSYRRKKITLSEYVIATGIPISVIQYYLKNVVEKQP